MTDTLPITEILKPDDQQQLVDAVKNCCRSNTPVYPIGGGTSLNFGLPAKRRGVGLSLAKLNRIVDYPARDMTITVEAGVTMRTLADTLAKENQRLPIDVPQGETATVGGVVATNFNGPRRYGQGSVRDHVIGISAVDGRGMLYHGGGRVVKNVAGYDFCKLLTGSLGTLGVITQLTLRLKPIPETLMIKVAAPVDLDEVEKLLAALTRSQTVPVAIELLGGPAWYDDPALADGLGASTGQQVYLAVALEGTRAEVHWMVDQLGTEWGEQGVDRQKTLDEEQSRQLMRRLAEFPAAGDSPLVLKANVVPSATTRFITAIKDVDSNGSFQAHAGNGIVIARFSELPAAGLSETLIGNLQAMASAAQGSMIILSNLSGAEATHQSVWGGEAAYWLMRNVKNEFDPEDLLNPDRFVYI